MKALSKSVLFGIVLWAVVFLSSVFIFPLKTYNPPFFETLISISLVLFTVIVSFIYFSKVESNIRNAVSAGIIWMLVNLIIDIPLFSSGPMKKPFADYMTDIGLTYLIIPIITFGIAYTVNVSKKNK